MNRHLLGFGVTALASSLAFGQMQQASPAWRPGPKTDAADVSTSAGADGSLTFAGKPSPARLYVTCSGAIPEMGRQVILKIVYRQPPGMPALSSSMKDMEHIEGVAKNTAWATPQLMALQGVRAMGTGTTLTLQTLPEPIDDMLENTGSPQEAFVETYTTPAGQAEFRFPIPPTGAMLKGVLDSCGFKPRFGDITHAFSQEALPVLKNVLGMKLHQAATPAYLNAVTTLSNDSKNQTELSIATELASAVNEYIPTEKKPADVVRRNRCIQSLIDAVTAMKPPNYKPCEALIPDMN